MKLSELKAGQGKVDIQVRVKSKEDPRVFNKYGRDLKVANATVADDSGEMKMSLWNDDADKVLVGQTLKITNGYVSEYNGEKQLTSGKFGKMEVLGEGSADSVSSAPVSSPAKKPASKNSAKKPGKEDSEGDVEVDEQILEDEDMDFEEKEF